MDIWGLYKLGVSKGNPSFLNKRLRMIAFNLARPYFEVVLEENQKLEKKIDALGLDIETVGLDIKAIGLDMEAAANRQLGIEKRFGEIWHFKDQLADLLVQRSRELSLGVSAAGGMFVGKRGDLISEVTFQGGIWDEHIYALGKEVSAERAGGIAIDIGANLGVVTVRLASLFREVYAFEPNDFDFQVLQANTVLNNLSNVRLFNHALYSRTALLSLTNAEDQEVPMPIDCNGEFDGYGSSNLGAYSFSENENGLSAHEAKSLDSFDLENVAFIKIDVQGADGEVLMGARETIGRSRPVIVFEWEEHLSKRYATDLRAVFEMLGEARYDVKVLKIHNEKQIDYVAKPNA
jgi:FkbM family methyltransferase